MYVTVEVLKQGRRYTLMGQNDAERWAQEARLFVLSERHSKTGEIKSHLSTLPKPPSAATFRRVHSLWRAFDSRPATIADVQNPTIAGHVD